MLLSTLLPLFLGFYASAQILQGQCASLIVGLYQKPFEVDLHPFI